MRNVNRWCSCLVVMLAAPAAVAGQPDVFFYNRVVERVFSTHAGNNYSTVVQYLDERGELQLVARQTPSGRRILQTLWCSPSIYTQLSNMSTQTDVASTASLMQCASQDVDSKKAPEVQRVLASAGEVTVDMSDDEYLILDGVDVRVLVRTPIRVLAVQLSAPRDLARSDEPVVRWADQLRRALGY